MQVRMQTLVPKDQTRPGALPLSIVKACVHRSSSRQQHRQRERTACTNKQNEQHETTYSRVSSTFMDLIFVDKIVCLYQEPIWL